MISFISAPSAASPSLAFPTDPGAVIKTLPNGLTIILREDHSAPVVSAQAWCRTGSIDEGPWLGAGLSHVLEHMLFKGTKTRPASRIDQEVQEAGGYMNAYTSFDRTVYHIDVPNTGTAVAIDILCDIMRNATLPEEELVKEKQVILREMDMNQDDPDRLAGRRLFETAFTRSPYRFTIIGYPDIYNEITREHLAAYYQTRYAPNNTFFVVVGDFSSESVLGQIERCYADAKLRALPVSVLPDEPPQTAPRDVIEEAPIELGHVHFSWHVPGIRHPDLPVLDMISAILGNGRSSRLFQNIRERLGLAHSASAWVYCPGEIGLFGLSAVVDLDKFPAACEAILAELEALKTAPPSEEELARSRNQFLAGTLGSRKTMQGQAQDLGSSWMASGDLGFSNRHLAAVQKVTPEDIHRVARAWLTEENRTRYALLPKGGASTLPVASASPAASPVSKTVLGNGLRLLVKEDHRLPFVEFRLAFKGGVLVETPESNGITQLAGRMLLQGTKTRSASQIANEIEALGGRIDTFGGNNSFGLSLDILASGWTKGLEILTDILLNSQFPHEELEREREHQLAGIKSQRDELLASAGALMRRGLFGPSGYGLDSLGTEESVGRLQAEDLRAFLHRWATPSNLVMAVFGDVDPAVVQKQVGESLGAWASSPTPPVPPRHPGADKFTRLVEIRDKKQAVIVVGFPGESVVGGDRFALDLLQSACSDLGSRLFTRIRDELGLAYYVGAHHSCGLEPGSFSFYAGTAPEKAELVERELLAQAALLGSEGLTAEELSRAKAKMIGQKKIARQDLGSLAISAVLNELYDLGHDFFEHETGLIEAVTLEKVRAAAGKFLTVNRAVVAVLRPEPGAEAVTESVPAAS